MAYSGGHICHCLSRLQSLRKDSPVVITGRRQRTRGEFANGVRILARGLAESGISRGDVVAVAALNSDWYIELLLAITYAGGIVAPLNHRWSFEEAMAAIELVRPRIIAVDEICIPWARKLQNSNQALYLKNYLLVGDSFPGFSSREGFFTMDSVRMLSQGSSLNDPISSPTGVALICFTSGTTGKPKGAALSHTALIVQSLAKIALIGYGENDVYLHTAPLCHIGGLSSCIAMLFAGACHVLMPKFDPKSTFEAINSHLVTSFICVPAIMADLIAYGRNFDIRTSQETVRKILNGGGGLSEELVQGASQLFPRAKIFSAYGMTEACSSLTFLTIMDPTNKKSEELIQEKDHQLGGVNVGKPAPHVELRICSGNSRSSPIIGSILTRGLHVMNGYWGHPEVNTEENGKHGWLDTGDIGWLDSEGHLWLTGRKKGRIKTGGENVYPEEVEAVLSQHPGVSSVIVVGIPDIRLSERVVACITIKEDWLWIDHNSNCSKEEKIVSPDILQNHCKQRSLSRFKMPRAYISWRKPFPVTSTGKLRRDDIRREIMSRVHIPSSL